MHTRAISTQLDHSDSARSFGFGHFLNLLLSKVWLIAILSIISLLAAGVYLRLTPKLYESHTILEVESKSGQAKLIRLQSTLVADLLERQANLTKAQADRESALAELQADQRLTQRGLISALDFQKAQIAANERSANYELEKKRYETARINNAQDFAAGDDGSEQDVNLDENIKTVEQAILNDTLLLGVLKSNGLEKDPSFAPPRKDGSAYLDSELVAKFRSRVKTAVRHGTRLIDVSVKDTDPKRAARLAEAIAKAFIGQNSQGFQANNGLGQEPDRVREKLQDVGKAAQADRGLNQSDPKPINGISVASGNSGENVRIVSTPLVAKTAEPDPLKTLLLALLVGITGGCGLVVIADLADNSIRTIDQAEQILGLTALAAIPESKRKSRRKEPALTNDPASYEAEAFRSLRTALSFLDRNAEHKTLLFTSANPKEGKSFCTLNYSVALAQTGVRTLLIDADIRRPKLSSMALSDANAQGLTDCLAGQANAVNCCHPTGIENLFVLPAGRATSRPSELFASCDFVRLLNELGAHFARIVLDSAPVNAVSDTQLICKHVQSVCFVVRARKTPVAAVSRACALLTQAGSALDGFVFNRMPLRSGRHHYFSGYTRCYADRGKKPRLKPKNKLWRPTANVNTRITETMPVEKI